MTIETHHLELIPCDADILSAAIKGNEMLAEKINCAVEENWTEFGIEALQYALDRLSESEEQQKWWTYFPIHKKDKMLIGSCGYKGKPTADGKVEIGYEVAPKYRNQGLATEITKGLIENAFKHQRVHSIMAHTLAEDNPSTKVLQKCGFEKVDEINDPDDGLIWKWELKRK